jgi:Uma2 family endonuclease
MSMPPIHQRRWTVREVARLIDERQGYTPRYELVGGELLVTPAPTDRHQRVIIQLAFRLHEYLITHRLGEVVLGPVDLRLDTKTRFEPDLCVVPAPDGRYGITGAPITRPPLLICEALSPSARRHDRFTKRRAFQRARVPEYWVADYEARAFEVWKPDDERPALLDGSLTWRPGGCAAPFELDVTDFFASIADGAPLR